jgi:hypothetical protein
MLTLFIMLDKTTMTAGDLPELTARLINEGDDVLLVNSRMLFAPEGSPDYMKEMMVFIEGPPDSINLKRVHVHAKAAERGDFVRLFPGEYLYSIYPLGKYFAYEDPGSYQVFAEYYNEKDLIVDGIRSWKGQIRSNEESFEIIA